MVAILALTGWAVWLTDEQLIAANRAEGLLSRFDGWVLAINQLIAGGPVSVTVGSVELLDPVLGLLSLVAVPHTVSTVLVAISLPVLLAVVLGRVFCGYLCPVGWLAVASFRLRRFTRRRPPHFDRSARTKFALVVMGLLLIVAIAGQSSTASLVLVHLQLQRLATHFVDPIAVWTAVGVLLAYVIFDFAIAPGVWCQVLCPSGIAYRNLARWRRWGICKRDDSPCPKGCSECNDNCWLELVPKSGVPGPACDACAACARACPEQKLRLGSVRPVRRKNSAIGRSSVALCVVLLSGLSPADAAADQPAPLLDANPPWSTEINQLDIEQWVRDEGHPGIGLAVSFVEHTTRGDLYIFFAARDAADPGGYPPATFGLCSDGDCTALRLARPNAPRSTSIKSIYSGRAFVPNDSCHRLSVRFAGEGPAVEVVFPESCRSSPWSPLALGLIAWIGLTTLFIAAGLLATRARSDRGGRCCKIATLPESRTLSS